MYASTSFVLAQSNTTHSFAASWEFNEGSSLIGISLVLPPSRQGTQAFLVRVLLTAASCRLINETRQILELVGRLWVIVVSGLQMNPKRVHQQQTHRKEEQISLNAHQIIIQILFSIILEQNLFSYIYSDLLLLLININSMILIQEQETQAAIIIIIRQGIIKFSQYIILKIMEKTYTPQKDPKSTNRNTAAQSYIRKTPDSVGRSAPASELALLKDYESLKIQVRQLQAKNRTLTSEVDQLLYQKNYNESKFVQKMNFEEETLAQFHKQKNYQMELLQIKHEEEMSRLKREHQLRVDQYLRDIKHKDYQLKEKDEQMRYLQLRNDELKRDYELLDGQLIKSREHNAIANQNLTHLEFRNKKLDMLVDELESQKIQMQSQIRVLLDIEAEKSRDINSLEIRLRNSEQNQRRLTQKLNILSENFNELEEHISIMKSKLISADDENHSLAKQLDHAAYQIKEKQRQIIDQNDRENQLRIQLDQHQKRQTRREREVAELMDENERLYKQLNINRHRLHEMGIAYGFDV